MRAAVWMMRGAGSCDDPLPSVQSGCEGGQRGLEWESNNPIMKASSGPLITLAASVLLGQAACVSQHFKHEWSSPQKSKAPVDIAGNWTGLWWSEGPLGHAGPLRATVRVAPEDEALLRRGEPGKMALNFDAGFGGWQTLFLTIHKGYGSEMKLTPAGDHYDVEGSQLLKGLGGGEYRYSGGIFADRFELRYESNYDNGTFYLERAK